MPNYQDPHFLKACSALAKQRRFRNQIKRNCSTDAKEILRMMQAEECLPDAQGVAYDYAVDFLTNEAPVVSEYEAEQDKGVYNVTIRGFPGAYFVQANEYDDSEVFPTLKAAEEYVSEQFGEFLC
jgi:hypothetical protein